MVKAYAKLAEYNRELFYDHFIMSALNLVKTKLYENKGIPVDSSFLHLTLLIQNVIIFY